MHQPELDPTRGWQRRTNHWLSAGETEEGYNGVDCLEWCQWTYRRLVKKKQADLVSYMYLCTYIAYFCSPNSDIYVFSDVKYAVKEVTEGAEYEFRVSAINESGSGDPSPPSAMVCAKNPNSKYLAFPVHINFCCRILSFMLPIFSSSEAMFQRPGGLCCCQSRKFCACEGLLWGEDSQDLFNWVGEITFTAYILVLIACHIIFKTFCVEHLTFDFMHLITPGRTSTWDHVAEGQWACIPLDSGYQYRGDVTALHSFVTTFGFSHLHHQSQELCGRGLIWYWSQSYR